MTRIILCTLISMLLVGTASARTILEQEVPDALTLGSHDFVLNGAGVRSKFVYDIYISALYLVQTSQDAREIIEADEPMAIRLYIISDLLTEERLIKYTYDGFKKSTNNNLAGIEDQVEVLLDSFRDSVNNEDVFDFVYSPDTGTEIFHNGQSKAIAVGLSFKQAVWGIWLSDKPVTVHLKNQMLGIE